MKSPFIGITYPHLLANRIVWILWKKYMCKRNIHLLDECWNGDNWYLSCDACNLEIHIKEIDTQYIKNK